MISIDFQSVHHTIFGETHVPVTTTMPRPNTVASVVCATFAFTCVILVATVNTSACSASDCYNG